MSADIKVITAILRNLKNTGRSISAGTTICIKFSMKTRSLSKLKKQLDKIFSLYIRTKYSKNGLVKCYTCSVTKPIKEIQNGHWIPRNVLGSRFSEENCRPQCVGCNMFNKGRPDVFAVNLMNEGVDIKELQKLRYKVFKVSSLWYEEKINEYTRKLKDLDSSS